VGFIIQTKTKYTIDVKMTTKSSSPPIEAIRQVEFVCPVYSYIMYIIMALE